MSSGAPNSPDSRGEAIRDWERETEQGQQRGRQFSGERLKGISKGDWLTKIAFVAGTVAVLFFILTHDSKEDRARKKEARAATQVEEPSVRDFRPPVMPVRTAMGTPQLVADSSKPVGKPTGSEQDDSEAAARRRKAEQIEEARTKSAIVVKGAGSTGPSQAAADAVIEALD